MSTDLTSLYNLRKKYAVIALTGRTGSGCTTIANQIQKGFIENDFPSPNDFDLNHNSFRKYKIIHKYAKENFEKHKVISYRDVLTLFLLKYPFEELIKCIVSDEIKLYFEKHSLSSLTDFTNEITQLNEIRVEFKIKSDLFGSINYSGKGKRRDSKKIIEENFYGDSFQNFSTRLHSLFGIDSPIKRYLLIQYFADNIRKSGNPFSDKYSSNTHIFTIAEMINFIIKASKSKDNSTKIVIDSLRNPFEVMFFKQRYAAFYLIAINREDNDRELKLFNKYEEDYSTLKELIDIEYKGKEGKPFFSQYVRECIEKADIHITYKKLEDVIDLNKDIIDNTSPYYSWQMQLLKYLSLIDHPGLITPSPEERSMQLAYTAKYNSGCISRQVGAAVTDEFYSVKAIGWNNTPEGQVPCLLRDAEVLLNTSDAILVEDLNKKEKDQDPELKVFTPFEKTNKIFKDSLKENFAEQIDNNKKSIKGRNVCFCFKTLHNSCFDGKNQVHTRSLHAEESAFLQIAKYGGTSIKDGKLFTTASPCELCSKKAYQLGIKVVYYIDPYPGISREQILETGTKRPSIRLFNGAIGNAYHWLYEPLMAYKDELSLILGQNTKDLASKQKVIIKDQEKRIRELELENLELRK